MRPFGVAVEIQLLNLAHCKYCYRLDVELRSEESYFAYRMRALMWIIVKRNLAHDVDSDADNEDKYK